MRRITVSESSLLRSPKASEGSGGALGEAEALKRGNTVGVRDQVMDLVRGQGMKVSRADLLPTPNTMDDLPARDGEAYELNLRRGNPEGSRREMSGNLREVVVHSIVPNPSLLPTVTTSDGNGVGIHGNGGQDLRTTIDLLPTVTTQDGKNTGGASQFERNTKPLNTQVLVSLEWGKFEPAIRRWEEVLGRPAPAPTKPDGKDGAHRLSSLFTEWMMGLPEGWITGCGLSRNEELKACGNGVVPQQAVLALRSLLDGIDIERERERERTNGDVPDTNG